MMMDRRRVYLDHSATTPVRSEVRELMNKYLDGQYGNPSSLHQFGRVARQGINWARETLAEILGANPGEIYFTSGGTEADNLAILGTASANQHRGRHVIISGIEHHAVLDPGKYLERQGFRVTYLPVDDDGLVQLAELDKALAEDTILISIMHANNEIGTIQPIAEISRRARERGIPFHTDAVQSLGKVPVNVNQLGVDLLSASAHKLYGPKGTGLLYVREGIQVHPLWYGGSQEQKLRPGTENVAGVVGFARAVELTVTEMPALSARLNALRDQFLTRLRTRLPGLKLNGHPSQRVPGHLNISFPGIGGQALLTALDKEGIAASSGSACTAKDTEPSHVLLAIGLNPEEVQGSVRLTLGRDNTEADLAYVLTKIVDITDRLQNSDCSCASE